MATLQVFCSFLVNFFFSYWLFRFVFIYSDFLCVQGHMQVFVGGRRGEKSTKRGIICLYVFCYFLQVEKFGVGLKLGSQPPGYGFGSFYV